MGVIKKDKQELSKFLNNNTLKAEIIGHWKMKIYIEVHIGSTHA